MTSPGRALAVFLAGAGAVHFVIPKFYDAMIPPQLPGSARTWTYGSGVAEIAVAAAVALPATRQRGAGLAALLFVMVFPGNLKMAVDTFGRACDAGRDGAGDAGRDGAGDAGRDGVSARSRAQEIGRRRTGMPCVDGCPAPTCLTSRFPAPAPRARKRR